MNPEDRLRALRDPERWTGVRLPHPAASAATPGSGATRRARLVPAVAAFAIVIAAVAGIAVAFASIPRGAAPAATDSPTVASASCEASSLSAKVGDSAAFDGLRTTIVAVDDSGSACTLPLAAFAIAGRAVPGSAGVVEGGFAIPRGRSELYLRTPQACAADDTPGRPVRPQLAALTLRFGASVRAVGVVLSSTCTRSVMGQFGGGSLIPAGKLAVLAAHPERFTIPTPTATLTTPVPTVACTAAQLRVTTRAGTGGATSSRAKGVSVANSSGACLLPPTAFSISGFRSRIGSATSNGGYAIPHGTSTLILAANMQCEGVRQNVQSYLDDVAPISLRVGGSTRVIGTFPTLLCEGPYIDQ